MSDFKPGDLVMVVKPMLCCGHPAAIGEVFSVNDVMSALGECPVCRTPFRGDVATFWKGSREVWVDVKRLKKIDPPAAGDSLPTRRDIEVPA